MGCLAPSLLSALLPIGSKFPLGATSSQCFLVLPLSEAWAAYVLPMMGGKDRLILGLRPTKITCPQTPATSSNNKCVFAPVCLPHWSSFSVDPESSRKEGICFRASLTHQQASVMWLRTHSSTVITAVVRSCRHLPTIPFMFQCYVECSTVCRLVWHLNRALAGV